MRPIVLFSLLAAATTVLAVTPASAAESYDNCAGTISSLPAVITGQGVWCVKADLSTAMTSGAAIIVEANNVTIDCNGFKVGGLAAGENTGAYGMFTADHANVTIRGCNVRGFNVGILMTGSGHIVEDNRIEGSRTIGVYSHTDGIIIRRNLIRDTGGSTPSPVAIEYSGDSDLSENIVTGVFPDDAAAAVQVYGIHTTAPSASRIRGNALRGLTTLGHTGEVVGIRVAAGQSVVVDNYLSAEPGPSVLIAIQCANASGFIRNNRAGGFDAMTSNCPADVSGNLLH